VFDSGRTVALQAGQVTAAAAELDWRQAHRILPRPGEELAAVLPINSLALAEYCVQVSRRACAKLMPKASFQALIAKGSVGAGIKRRPDKTALLVLCGREDGLALATREGNLVTLPVNPFIAPTYREITHTIAERNFDLTRRLLKRVSIIAGAWTLAAGGVVSLFGYWLVPWMYGAEYRPAYPALVILLVGYGFANILHWNRPLLLALGKPGYPLKSAAVTGSIKTLLTFLVVPVYGFLAEAAILSGYFLSSIGLNVWRGRREIAARELEDTAPPEVA